MSKARKAAYVAFRLISETRGVFHSIDQIKEAVQRFFKDGSKKAVIQRLRTKKFATKIMNFYSSNQALVFKVINTSNLGRVEDLELSPEGADLIKRLVHEQENEKTLKFMAEAHKRKQFVSYRVQQDYIERKREFGRTVGGIMMAKKALRNQKNKHENPYLLPQGNQTTLKDLAFITNPQLIKPKKVLTQAEKSLKRFEFLSNTTKFNMADHMNVRKQMPVVSKLLTEQPLSLNYQMSEATKNSRTIFSSPLKKLHRRSKSGPLSMTADFKISSRFKDGLFKTAQRHKKS